MLFLISSSISGLNDLKKEDVYQWADGTNITITSKWLPREPNNLRNEDCVEVKWDGRWNDLACSNRLGFICETRLGNEKKYIIFMSIYLIGLGRFWKCLQSLFQSIKGNVYGSHKGI